MARPTIVRTWKIFGGEIPEKSFPYQLVVEAVEGGFEVGAEPRMGARGGDAGAAHGSEPAEALVGIESGDGRVGLTGGNEVERPQLGGYGLGVASGPQRESSR